MALAVRVGEIFAQFLLRDGFAMNLVGTIGQAQHPRARPGIGEVKILADASSAADLDGAVDLDARLRDPLADDAVVRDIAAEGMTAERTLAQRLERTLGNADEPHAMVNAAGSEPALRDFEAAPRPQQDVRD